VIGNDLYTSSTDTPMEFLTLRNVKNGEWVWSKDICQCLGSGIRGIAIIGDTMAINYGNNGKVYQTDENFAQPMLIDSVTPTDFKISFITNFNHENNRVLLQGFGRNDDGHYPFDLVLNPVDQTILRENFHDDLNWTDRFFFIEDYSELLVFDLDTSVFIQKLDSTQSVIWEKTYDYRFRRIFLDNSDNIILIESVNDTTNNIQTYNNRITKIASNGELIWRSDTMSFKSNGGDRRYFQIMNVQTLSDKSVVAVASELYPHIYYGGNFFYFLLRFDSTGQLMSQLDLRGYPANEIVVLDNEDLLLFGETTYGGAPTDFMMKISELFSRTELQEIELDDVKIYPNPAHDIVHISSNDNKPPETVVIWDSKGRMVLENQVKNGVISVSNLMNGNYYAQIFFKDNMVVKTFSKQ